MKHPSAKDTPNETHARTLLTAIEAAPTTILPRRETIVDWLNALLLRNGRPADDVDSTETTETADLAALEKFLRTHDVPVARHAA